MKNLLYTLIAFFALTSCQDKFEQIDANFAYLDAKLEEKVADLQAQIDATNVKLDADVAALTDFVNANVAVLSDVDDALAQAIADGDQASAEALELAKSELEAQLSELNAAIEALVVADGVINDKIAELNAALSNTSNDVAQNREDINAIQAAYANEVAMVKAELLGYFNSISVSTTLAVAEFLVEKQLEVTSIVIEVINEVLEANDVEMPDGEQDDTEDEDDDEGTMSIEEQVISFLNSAPGTVVEINGATLTVSSVNLYNVVVNGNVSWRAVTASVTFEQLVADIVSLVQ